MNHHRVLKIVGCLVALAVLSWSFYGIARAQHAVCRSYHSQIKIAEQVAQATLTPIAPPPSATPEQLLSYRSANAQKKQRLAKLEDSFRRAVSCPTN